MSGFSPEWLALREPVDHRSRDQGLAGRLGKAFANRGVVNVVDLGCGTGSNLRGTFNTLPGEQHWTLVDYEPRLLAAAKVSLAAWADAASGGADGEPLELRKGGRRLLVRFRQADLNEDLDRALGEGADLVTAAAFFDLCSAAFIEQLAVAVASRRAAFYTVLTYNGVQSWAPEHPADAALLAAFLAHQQTDKGFGAAAGWQAAERLRDAFQARGYRVDEGDSPWRMGQDDAHLIGVLATGFADAASEVGKFERAALTAWRAIERTGAEVGHTDTLALPE